MSEIVEVKYVVYVTTQIEHGTVDYIDERQDPPEAVLIGGERVPLLLSASLDRDCITSITVVPDRTAEGIFVSYE